MKLHSRIAFVVAGLVVLLGAIGTVKALQIKRLVAQGKAIQPPPQTVTVHPVNQTNWETSLRAVGSLQAVQGVMVTAELPGKVTRIVFEPGAAVKKGQLLLQQDISFETAQLQAAQSKAGLALKNLERARELRDRNVIPVATFDELVAEHEQAVAQEDLIRATIAKKTIRAPFGGRLGIRQVNPGEVLEGGQPIVTLQSLDRIFVNFQLPQQELSRLKPGLEIRVLSDALDGQEVAGKITAVNPEVDGLTRNVEVQGTLPNPGERLRAGMFARVTVVLPATEAVLAIPATAVHYAPYSDSVFLVESAGDDGAQKKLVLRQQFVQLGPKRGDFVVVRQGLQAGQEVVSTGVFKLRNGQSVVVDNRLAPTFETDPEPADA